MGNILQFTSKHFLIETKGSKTEKQNISRPLLKVFTLSAIADHVKTTGHNIKWDHHLAKLGFIAKRLCTAADHFSQSRLQTSNIYNTAFKNCNSPF